MEFYQGATAERDAADTARNGAGVLNSKGQVKMCAPTGFRIMTPNIDGVGSVRIRYPIFPVHSEGSTVGMEVDVRALVGISLVVLVPVHSEGSTVGMEVDVRALVGISWVVLVPVHSEGSTVGMEVDVRALVGISWVVLVPCGRGQVFFLLFLLAAAIAQLYG